MSPGICSEEKKAGAGGGGLYTIGRIRRYIRTVESGCGVPERVWKGALLSPREIQVDSLVLLVLLFSVFSTLTSFFWGYRLELSWGYNASRPIMSRSKAGANIARLNDLTLGAFSSVQPSETLDHLIRYLSTWSGSE